MIVITGATGFVGGALARALTERGEEVRCLVRHSADLRPLRGLPNSTYFYADITQPDTLQEAFNSATAVIHCAGMLGQHGQPEEAYFRLHVEGTRNVLNALLMNNRTARLLYVSSPGVLGVIDRRNPSADETAPLAPTNPYERSKAAAERLVMTYTDRLEIVIGRPEFIYGTGDRHVLGLFRAIQRRIFFYINGGHALCHPTYIADAVQGLLLALEKGRAGEIYHVTGEKAVSFRQLGETIADALRVRPPFLSLPKPMAQLVAVAGERFSKRPPLTRTGVAFFTEDRHFSWQKSAEQLAYQPAYSLERGVQETVAWYRAQGWLA